MLEAEHPTALAIMENLVSTSQNQGRWNEVEQAGDPSQSHKKAA